MKIEAKDLKVGMRVRDGYLTIEIIEIVEGKLKNGKDIRTVSGKGTRKHTASRKVTNTDRSELTFKSTTKVNIG